MDRLYAPWRAPYLKIVDKKKTECVFCAMPQKQQDAKHNILYRGKTVYAVMNKYPYNNGHMLVVPFRHLPEIEMLNNKEMLEMMQVVCKSKIALIKAFGPQGFNVGINQGRVAGAGIEEHLHTHILPRWNGDTNFMP
ncbi:MAG: HIT domain-containing protein, partial [bacterium]